MNFRNTLFVLVAAAVITVVTVGLTVTSILDSDASQKQQITAQTEVRTLAFDKLYKKIAQKTQITKASSTQQKELVEALIQGRQGGFVRLIQESNPESAFSREQFADLSNTVDAEREGFFREQKVLVDLIRENHTLHDSVVSGTMLDMFGREKADAVPVISSTQTESVIASGKDDNIDLGS